MAVDDAKKLWKRVAGSFKPKQEYRFALTGDGRGNAASNLIVPNQDGYIYAREYSDQARYFPVLNRGRVGAFFNLPIIIGRDDIEPEQEQVLAVNYSAMPTSASASTYSAGAHHHNHEYGGGDEVYIDGRLFMPGLVYATNPPSMQVKVNEFVYHYNDKNNLSPSLLSVNLSQYKPAGVNVRFVGIFFDPESEAYIYKIGDEYYPAESLTWDSFFSTAASQDAFDIIPKPVGAEYPLGTIYLTSATSLISSLKANNLYDTRLHLAHSFTNFLDRFNQLEGYVGNDPSISLTGAAQHTVDNFRANAWGIQGRTVDATEPTDGQGLAWNSSTNSWKPAPSTSPGHFSFTISASSTWNNTVVPIWQAPRGGSVDLLEIDAVASGTTPQLAFNIERRPWQSITSVGTNVFATDQNASASGAALTSLSLSRINPRDHLVFTTDNGAETGTVELVHITVYYGKL